jgi:hypothetical protein
MSLVQPDLFGEATCPRCCTTEPNGHLLDLNHGAEPGKDTIHGAERGEHSIYGDYCTAQYLVANHIHADIVHGWDDDLARSVDEGRALGLDTDAIIAQARAEAAA